MDALFTWMMHAVGQFQSLPYMQRTQIVLVAALFSGCYLKFVTAPRAGNHGSIITVLPVVALNYVLPSAFRSEELLSKMVVLIALFWAGSFKVNDQNKLAQLRQSPPPCHPAFQLTAGASLASCKSKH
jgi:hypothetical protein